MDVYTPANQTTVKVKRTKKKEERGEMELIRHVGVCKFCGGDQRPCCKCGSGNYCEDDHKCQHCGIYRPGTYECDDCEEKIKGEFARCFVCQYVLCPACVKLFDCECGEEHQVCDSDHLCQYRGCSAVVCHEGGAVHEALGGGKNRNLLFCTKHQKKIVREMKRIKIE